jgi:hypothetical protein
MGAVAIGAPREKLREGSDNSFQGFMELLGALSPRAE